MIKILYKVSTRWFLVLAVLLALVPFLDLRVLRMAGDEKVYVSTAIEMARQGNWFVQTLADEPNYFKGPMHYLFTRAGLLIFGNRLIAGTWMNAALALASALVMYRLGRKRWGDKSGLLLGLATGLNVGVFSHSLASQMEVEVFAFYAFATAALGLATRAPGTNPTYKSDVWFWLAAGLAAWIKSPLHSVLITAGGVFYWALTKQLFVRLRSLQSWLAMLTGVAAGVAGYVPILIYDYQNFWNTYILREQFEKANNNRQWDYVMKPLIHFLLPWTFVVLAGLAKVLVHFLPKGQEKKTPLSSAVDMPMLKLGLAMSLPTLLFWCTWTYKGQNYNLPAIPAILLFGWACFNGNAPRSTLRGAGLVGILGLLLTIGLVSQFIPLPDWWSLAWVALALAMISLFIIAFLFTEDVRAIGAGAVAFFIAFGAMITPFGEREMIDIRKFLKDHPNVTLHYYNLDPSIWSEWGLLQLTLHKTVNGLHKPSQLAKATQPGHAVLVQNNDALNVVMNYWRKHGAGNEPIVKPWMRWLTKGKTSDGKSKWRAAWEGHDLHQLEREFFIVYFP